ncbi:FCD domain-containing protein [Leisingera aquaemixtae]|nr:FCD domain-containing protein [Leisingera aquaemixtae]
MCHRVSPSSGGSVPLNSGGAQAKASRLRNQSNNLFCFSPFYQLRRPSCPPQAIETDLSLHEFLADGLGNSLLAAAYDANWMRIAVIQNSRPFVPDRIASAMEEHLAILEALKKRDAEAVADAIRHHCEQTLRWRGVRCNRYSAIKAAIWASVCNFGLLRVAIIGTRSRS